MTAAHDDPAASDLLILVDSDDEVIGSETKLRCHDGAGLLHRAFSVFLFNGRGEVLLQQRADKKRLWGGFWSNSCCSHPREGEATDEAAVRRLDEELGVESVLKYLYKFEYQASFGDAGSENELCWVFVGRCDAEPIVDPDEISATRWIAPEELDREMETSPDGLTPWFRMEWQRLRGEFADTIAAL